MWPRLWRKMQSSRERGYDTKTECFDGKVVMQDGAEYDAIKGKGISVRTA